MANLYNIEFVKRVIALDFKAAGPIGHNAIDNMTTTTYTGYLKGVGGVINSVVQIPSGDVADLNVSNWNTAYSWGNHADAGYLTSESDPVVGAVNGLVKADGAGNISSAVAGTDYLATGGWYDAAQNAIALSGFNDDLSYENPLTFGIGLSRVGDTVTNDITQYTDSDAVAAIKSDADWNAVNWNTAYSWGNHADAGYLTSESDPVFSASAAAGIASVDITNWNSAYGWGDHSAVGYLTSVNISDINATGTPSSTTYLRGDGTWSEVDGGSGGISGTTDDLPEGDTNLYNQISGVEVSLQEDRTDMGVDAGTNPSGYYRDLLTNKTHHHSKIGVNTTGEDGGIGYEDGRPFYWKDSRKQDVLIGIDIQESVNNSVKYSPFEGTLQYQMHSGDSVETGVNGVPLVQGYVNASMGAYPADEVLFGGTF